MALTFTQVKQFGGRINAYGPALKLKVYDITCDASYSSGGWAITAANVGLTSTILAILPQPVVGGAVFGWNATTGKLMAYKSNTAALLQEISAGDASTFVVRCFCFGY